VADTHLGKHAAEKWGAQGSQHATGINSAKGVARGHMHRSTKASLMNVIGFTAVCVLLLWGGILWVGHVFEKNMGIASP